MENFGKRLSRLMKKEGMSIRAAAKMAEVPASTLSGWTANTLPSDFKAVKRLSEHLGVSLTYLLTGEEDTLRGNIQFIPENKKEEVYSGLLEVSIKKVRPDSEG